MLRCVILNSISMDYTYNDDVVRMSLCSHLTATAPLDSTSTDWKNDASSAAPSVSQTSSPTSAPTTVQVLASNVIVFVNAEQKYGSVSV